MTTASNGPDVGSQVGAGGRARNTMANLMSKYQTDYTNPGGTAALPALSPAQTAASYAQQEALYVQYSSQLAAYKQQRVGLRASAGAAKAGIRSTMISGLGAEENAAIGRGVLGGSEELQSRIGIRADAAGQQAALKADTLSQLAGTRIGEMQAGAGYMLGSANLAASNAAAQQTALAQQLQNNLIISGQESTMDIMAAMYKSQMAALAGTPTKAPNKGTPAPAGGGYKPVPNAYGYIGGQR